jgi:hypothetical protein
MGSRTAAFDLKRDQPTARKISNPGDLFTVNLNRRTAIESPWLHVLSENIKFAKFFEAVREHFMAYCRRREPV